MKKKSIKIIVIIVFILSIIVLIYSFLKINNWKDNSNRNNSIKEKINESVDINKEENKIDFKKLKEQNPDTVGYIKVNGTNIDYIIVKTNDNDYYLNHNFNKEYNIEGWIFADYRNKLDDTDNNIIIYGHNSHDNNMFSTLKKVLQNEWQNNINNREILFITEANEYKYQVFSTYMIEPEDYYIETDFSNNVEYLNFLNTLKNRSNYNYGIELEENDKILTLSSCNNDGTKRIVLHAVKS